MTDVWSKETTRVGHTITLTVEPHETRLIRVMPALVKAEL